MADENKPAFYPRVGRNIAKNFRSAKPPAFIDDPRAMELPRLGEDSDQFGRIDLSVPSKENLELGRRIAERDAQLRRQQQADRSPLEKLAGGVQAGRFLGSALTQAVNSAPTRLFKGDEAADKFIEERMYKPEQPLAYEYAGDVGDFLEKLETEYKIPPVLPEAVALQFLTAPAASQAKRMAGKGAEQAGYKVPKYLTTAEKDDLAGKLYELQTGKDYKTGLPKEPPAAGMKAGGKVSISSNPDTMMLEVNNQKMAKGGLSKLIRAAPKSKAEIDAIARRMAPQLLGEFVRGDKGTQSVAGKTQKQFAKEKEMVHDIRPTGAERPLPREVDIEELKDQVMVGIAGDPTISGQTLYSVDGVPLESPSPQHGGPFYGLGNEDDAFWASGLSAANRVQNIAREASQQYDLPVLGNYVMMGPDSINYAQHYADANLAAINPAKMSRGQIEAFNKMVREGYPYKKKGEDFTRQRVFPAFPGIENPSEAYLHFSIDPELRKHFNALMQMPTVTEKYNLPSGIDVRHAVTEPDLRDLEIGVTGKSIGRLRPEITELGLSSHPTYSHDIPGEFMGTSKYPVPYELSFPDTVKSVRENPKQAPQEFGSFKYVGPRQVIDQQLIDEIKQYQEMIKKYTGKKKGGAVKKAAGGEITGDDLIIEERPL